MRGSNEIASYLKYFVGNWSGQIKQVYLFADNCIGQNKNRFITQMLSIAAMERKNDNQSYLPRKGAYPKRQRIGTFRDRKSKKRGEYLSS